jgi:glycosyltransferase involved in cell wall biosynthesis
LVDPDSVESIAGALARVLTEESLRARMRERGLVQAARFNWLRSAQETLAVYRDTLGR